MKKTYSFTIRTVVFAILVIVGLVTVVIHVAELVKFSGRAAVNSYTEENIKPNHYYSIDVSDVYIKSQSLFNEAEVVLSEHIGFLRNYKLVAVSVGDGKYMECLVSSNDMIRKLEAIAEGNKESGVVYIGKSVKKTFYENWYEDIPDIDANNIIQTYSLRLVTAREIRTPLFIGIYMILIAGFAFVKSIVSYVPHVEPQKVTGGTFSRRRHQSFNLDNELLSAKRKLTNLEKQRQSQKKWAILGAVLILFGIVLPLARFSLETLLAGLGFFIVGFLEVANWYLNSENEKASNIAAFFGMDTNYKKQLVTKALITRLEEEIEADRAEKEKENAPIIHYDVDEADDDKVDDDKVDDIEVDDIEVDKEYCQTGSLEE